MNHVLSAWQALPDSIKKSDDGRKLKEVVAVISAWFGSYLDLLSEFNKRFDERVKEIERDLLRIKF